MHLILNQTDFDQLCEKLNQESILYIDTEFYRRNTYYAKLCLIQIATKKEQYLIDALSGINLQQLKKILSNKKIVKVFHSADQDLQIIYHTFKIMPENIFDTQVAANVCGIGRAYGYQKLCKEILNIDVDKTLQTSDWQVRPLSEELMKYAMKDTEYLIPLYEKLYNIIDAGGLWPDFHRKTTELLDQQKYKSSPERVLSRIRLPNDSDYFRERMLLLVTFREECAIQLDIPRSYFLTDDELISICQELPTTDKHLQRLVISHRFLNKNDYKSKLLDLCVGIREAKSTP